VRLVADVVARFSAVCVYALNRCDFGEQAVLARMTLDIDQQPWDRVGIERVDMTNRFAGDFAAIFQFPRRAGRMLPNHFILPVGQVRFGSP
jgi:hypothetical protein